MTTANIASYERSAQDDLIYNDVIVTRLDSGGNTIGGGRATNDDPLSPTSVSRIGPRQFFFESEFIVDDLEADTIAQKFLAIHAQEQFDFQIGGAVYPWLEVGNAILIDAEPDDPEGSGFPTRFLLTHVTIPMNLGDMSLNAGRVSLVVGS